VLAVVLIPLTLRARTAAVHPPKWVIAEAGTDAIFGAARSNP
jgi:hypothetical protein